jgi:hypothetical protein
MLPKYVTNVTMTVDAHALFLHRCSLNSALTSRKFELDFIIEF